MMTTLIVEDEPLTRSYLRQALEAQGVLIVGEAEDGTQGLQLARALCPALIVLDLDLQAPGLTGLQLGRALPALDSPPLVALVSGSTQHAVMGFELGAMDYLMKPVAPDRLAKMLARARFRLADRRARQEARAPGLTALALQRRVPVGIGSSVRLIRIEEIDYVESRERGVTVRTEEGEYRTSCSVGQLESLLPPDRFFRLHNSYLVQLERVEELLFLGNHRYSVRLSGGQVLPVGRSRYAALRQRLGLDRAMDLGDGRLPEEEAGGPSAGGNQAAVSRPRPLAPDDASGRAPAAPRPAERH